MNIQVIGDIQLTKNFKLSEFVCNDGSGKVMLDMQLVILLQKLREKAGKPIIITNAYRTYEHNKKVGGSPNSQHMLGKAADIKLPGLTPKQIAKLAEEVGFTGIGIYSTFCHVDVRPHKSRWNG